MNRILTILVVLASCAFGASSKAKTINGVKVIPKGTFVATPAVEVYDLKFYEAFAPEKGTGVTVITGTLVHHYPNNGIVVHIDITMLIVPGTDRTAVRGNGVCRATVERPEPHKPTRFAAVANYWFDPDGDKSKDGWKPHYCLVTTVARWSPPKVDPVEGGLGSPPKRP